MNNSFEVYKIENAPEKSKPLLENIHSAFGMVPNLHAVLAEAPVALEAYMKLHELVMQTSLSNVERHIVWMTINTENDCHYCIPAHAMLATMDGVDKAIINAVRNKQIINDDKLESLRNFTISVVQNRGNTTEKELTDFYNAGYTKQNVLEIVVVLSQKIISNYSNHITQVTVDEAFKAFI